MPSETTVFERQRPFVVVWYRSLQVRMMASQVVHEHECYIFFFYPHTFAVWPIANYCKSLLYFLDCSQSLVIEIFIEPMFMVLWVHPLIVLE